MKDIDDITWSALFPVSPARAVIVPALKNAYQNVKEFGIFTLLKIYSTMKYLYTDYTTPHM